MSVAYEFRKLYADVVDPQGHVLVVYLNYVRLAGLWSGRASVEGYTPDGQRTLEHSVSKVPVIDADTPLAQVPLELELPSGPFRLERGAQLGHWRPERPTPTPPLHWHVKAARTQARATFAGRVLEGTGYVDWVDITQPTRLLGLRELTWGRVHLPDRTVVLERLTTVRDEVWNVGVDWRLGEAAPRPLAGAAALCNTGEGQVPLEDGMLSLTPQRVLHDGNAFDPDRVPRALDRALCEALGGPTYETRWLGTGRLGDREALALYERVRFGR